jgi:type II secretory pathway pseudopilin PulG
MNSIRAKLRKSSVPAFTLVEMIVAMLIFTVFIGVLSSSYFFLSRSLRQAAELRKVYGEARFVMDRVTQDVRLYTLDYDCFEDSEDFVLNTSSLQFGECQGIQLSGSGLTQTLPLISSDGLQRTVYRFQDGIFSVLKLMRSEVDASWAPAEGYSKGFQPFVMDRVELRQVQFVVAPLESPYAHVENDSAQYQPSVNVVVRAASHSSIFPEVAQIQLQSTISSRVYGVTF